MEKRGEVVFRKVLDAVSEREEWKVAWRIYEHVLALPLDFEHLLFVPFSKSKFTF